MNAESNSETKLGLITKVAKYNAKMTDGVREAQKAK